MMRIVITGTPGTGKSVLAKAIAKKLGCRVINEKEFALEHRIGKWDKESDELAVPLGKLKQALNKELAKTGKQKSIVVEGHMVCEIPLKADVVVVMRLHPEILESRLERRSYRAEKVQDNVFCEGIDYCKKQVLKNYKGKKIIEIDSSRGASEALRRVSAWLKEI